MAGRGRGLTLPAWMTNGELEVTSNIVVNPPTPSSNQMELEPQRMQIPNARPPSNPPYISSQAQPFPSFSPPPHPSAMYAGSNMYSNQPIANNFMPNMNPYSHIAQSVSTAMPLQMQMHQPMQHGMNMGMMYASYSGNPNGGSLPNMNMAVPGTFIRPSTFPKAPPTISGGLVGGPGVPAPPAIIGDPNNDASCWVEHESEEGKKYWYNRVSLVSTYDKPFCLKTPEERSIPPCAWKEYPAADGKKYYSNGTESTWTMPEEYRSWKERVDAVEERKKEMHQQKLAEEAVALAAATSLASEIERSAGDSLAQGGHNGFNTGARGSNAAAAEAPVSYGSYAEAADAFKDLLGEMKVSTVAKMKEVQDLCQHDARWEALKSQGEKKQALAEYQTKRLKQEKEQQKVKARKHRDAFLLMLAENTDIDARTRWRDATAMLQEDARYKNLEDPRDREDLFQEFILELEKKEKEDKRRHREAALAQFDRVLGEFAAAGKITRKSVWGECKKLFVDLVCKAEYRAMDDTDFRRSFQSFTAKLEDLHRAAELKRKQEFEEHLAAYKTEFRALLESFAKKGDISTDSKFKDVIGLEDIRNSDEYVKLKALFSSGEDSAFLTAGQEVFDAVLRAVQNQVHADKKLVKSALSSQKWRVRHDTTFAEYKSIVLRVARVKEVEEEAAAADSVAADGGTKNFKVVVVVTAAVAEPHLQQQSNAEEGEEPDEAPSEEVRVMLLERPAALAQVFGDLRKRAAEEHAEEERAARKVESKFLALMQEKFHRAEHVGMPWDEAKKTLQRRSVYDELGKTDRRRLFSQYMADLARKYGAAATDSVNAVPVAPLPKELEPVAGSGRERGGGGRGDSVVAPEDDHSSRSKHKREENERDRSAGRREGVDGSTNSSRRSVPRSSSDHRHHHNHNHADKDEERHSGEASRKRTKSSHRH